MRVQKAKLTNNFGSNDAKPFLYFFCVLSSI